MRCHFPEHHPGRGGSNLENGLGELAAIGAAVVLVIVVIGMVGHWIEVVAEAVGFFAIGLGIAALIVRHIRRQTRPVAMLTRGRFPARQIRQDGPAAVEGGTHYHQHLHVDGLDPDELARVLRGGDQ